MERSAVIAVGGNALILDGQQGTIGEQFENARTMAHYIGRLVVDGWRIALSHGNGPQVGFILLRSELVGDSAPVPKLSLDMCVADSQGGIGYILGNSLLNQLGRLGMPNRVVCMLTHTVVDEADPAFQNPTKPIGPFYTETESMSRTEKNGWQMVEDAGRGYRRVVPSPHPLKIVEAPAIQALMEQGYLVIAAGGGGIPVAEKETGVYTGLEAVIDKDLASALLAASLGVPTLVISTGVEKVAIHFRKPDQMLLDRISVSDARHFLEIGELPNGSMGPKVRAAIEFLELGGKEVIITSPPKLEEAISGETGTRIVPDTIVSLRPVERCEEPSLAPGLKEAQMATVKAEPYEFEFDPKTTALVIIDMQRDFVDPGGFGEALGNDVSLLRKAVPPTERVLKAAREAGLLVIHTREGHRPDLTDLPASKKARGKLKTGIGDMGPMGRILVRGEYGHDIVDELKPMPGEPVVDKPGKGAFYATDLDMMLRMRGIQQLVVCGVTTEVCVNTTVREANDRGYDALVLEDCVASYFPEFQEYALKMVKAQGGIFGWVSDSESFLKALREVTGQRIERAA